MPRIASLLPSTTEIACALGFQADLVGRSHECELPPGSAELPVRTQPKLDAGARSLAIDEQVRTLVRDGLSVYRVDAERLRELAPDVILTQDQCEVCAASLPDVEAALAAWIGRRRARRGLRAMREGRAFLADGHRLMNRPGPGLVESLEVLVEILQPDAIASRHRGSGWERL